MKDYARAYKSKRCRALLLVALLLSLLYGFTASVDPVEASAPEQATLYCTGVSYTLGGSYSGSHENTHASDDQHHWSYGKLIRIWDERWINYYVLEATYSFNIGQLDRHMVSKVEVNGEARTNAASSTEVVELYIFNYTGNSWKPFATFLGNTSDVTFSWSALTVNSSDYIDGAGDMKLRWNFAAEDFSKVGIDFQCIKLTMRQWAFMVYLDADCYVGNHSGQYFGDQDLNEMEIVGSTPDVGVIVQMDRLNHTAKRYFVTKDNDINTITSPVVQELGEVNMGSNDTLVNFVEWVINNYAAHRYCLVLWNHGFGFEGVCWDDTDNSDFLSMTELKSALNTIYVDTNRTMDLIGFHACVMQMTEVTYQIRDYASVMVASEETMYALLKEENGGGGGWPYNTVLGNLTADPDMDAAQFGEKIVDAYEDFWTPTRYIIDPKWLYPYVKLTLSAIRMTQLDNLTLCLRDFAITLNNSLSDPTQNASIRQCRATAQNYTTAQNSSHWYHVDLYNFTKLVYDNPNISATIKDTAYYLMGAINSTVIHEWHHMGDWSYWLIQGNPEQWKETWEPGCPGSHGLSIYFPQDPDDYSGTTYESLALSEDHPQWNEFLKNFLGLPL